MFTDDPKLSKAHCPPQTRTLNSYSALEFHSSIDRLPMRTSVFTLRFNTLWNLIRLTFNI